MANWANLIEDQADPWYRQKILHQDGYGAKVLVGTKEAFAKTFQATAEDRSAVTNLTVINMNLTTKVEKYANHLATKDSTMSTMKKNQTDSGGDKNPK